MFDIAAFGNAIRKYRKIRNFTIEQMAEELEISWIHLSNIERGKVKYVSVTTLISILNYFDLNFGDVNNGNMDKFSEDELKILEKVIKIKVSALSSQGKEFILDNIIFYKDRMKKE